MENTVRFCGFNCIVEKHKYNNGRIALRLIDVEDKFPVATASVNIPHAPCGENETYIKDYSENDGILNALISAKIVRDTGKNAIAGFELANLVEVLI